MNNQFLFLLIKNGLINKINSYKMLCEEKCFIFYCNNLAKKRKHNKIMNYCDYHKCQNVNSNGEKCNKSRITSNKYCYQHLQKKN